MMRKKSWNPYHLTPEPFFRNSQGVKLNSQSKGQFHLQARLCRQFFFINVSNGLIEKSFIKSRQSQFHLQTRLTIF